MKIYKLVIGLVVLLSIVSLYLFVSKDKLSDPRPAYAEVITVNGNVKHLNKQSVEIGLLKTGYMVATGEIIETSNKSSITLRFVDNSVALISENSIVEMSKLIRSGESLMAVTNLYIIAGNIESKVSKQNSFGAEYKVVSPALQLSVRGTVFIVKTDKDSGRTIAMVTEGKIIASAMGESMDLDNGYGIVINKGESLQAATKLLKAPVINKLDTVVKYFPIDIKWDSLPGAEKYHVQLFSGSDFNSIVNEEYVSINGALLNNLPNASYMVRIRGVDDSELEGFSANYKFELDAHPIAPKVIGPRKKEIITSKRTILTWNRSLDAKAYSIQISKFKDFASIEASIEELPESMNSISIRLKDGEYYWRILSIDDLNNKGPYSPIQSFIISRT